MQFEKKRSTRKCKRDKFSAKGDSYKPDVKWHKGIGYPSVIPHSAKFPTCKNELKKKTYAVKENTENRTLMHM